MNGTGWSRDDVKELRKLYEKAVVEKKEIFKFQGHDVLTSNIPALLESLEAYFKKGRKS